MIEIRHGDCREVMRGMEPASVHCVVTSPPYWGLRVYAGEDVTVWGSDDHEHEWGERTEPRRSRSESDATTEKQKSSAGSYYEAEGGVRCRCGAWRGSLGLEPTLEMYVEHTVEVFREVRRVLRDDGTVWLNMGDSYNSGPGWGRGGGSTLDGGIPHGYRPGSGRADGEVKQDSPRNRDGISAPGLKPKDLIGIPWRVAFALQADGWWLRSDIVWSKPNPMPESVTDRPTRAHEYVFLLAKSARYYYDADAIREPMAESSIARISQPTFDQQTGGPKDYAKTGVNRHRSARKALEGLKERQVPASWATSSSYADQDPRYKKRDKQRGHGRRHDDFNDCRDAMTKEEQQSMGANKRTVWEIATQPFPDAHFATFPEALVKPCILAGCPEGGTVLDPFAGSGTVGVVAQKAGRSAILIEQSAEYVEMMQKRLAQRALV